MTIDEKIMSLWGKEAFSDANQIKRLKSAISSKLIPINKYESNTTCIFQGSGKKPYTTTLDSCDCRDYVIHRKPCKHMYRTAIEFKLITDIDIIKDLKQNIATNLQEDNKNNPDIKETQSLTCKDFIVEEKLLTYWGEEAFTENDQMKRLKSATSAKLTPIEKDAENLCCTFQGSGKKPYITTFDSCDCRDYIIRRRPCKHMYRLALEFDKIRNLETSSDLREVERAYETTHGYSLAEAVDITERLTNEEQISLWHCLNSVTKENNPQFAPQSESIQKLISCNILETVYDLKRLLSGYRRNELNKRIASTTPELKFNKNMKTEILIDWCLKNLTENQILEMCSDGCTVRLQAKFLKSRAQLYRYLDRKYSIEPIFYNKQELEISLLDTVLPDDKVTHELIRRGYYNPNDLHFQLVKYDY